MGLPVFKDFAYDHVGSHPLEAADKFLVEIRLSLFRRTSRYIRMNQPQSIDNFVDPLGLSLVKGDHGLGGGQRPPPPTSRRFPS